MIVFDVSVLVGAALKIASIPEQAVLRARQMDVFALSLPVYEEMLEVLGRPKFMRSIPANRAAFVMSLLVERAAWFEPRVRVTDCRDEKDNKYLELALAAGAGILVSSDEDLLVLDQWRGIRIISAADYLRRA